MTNKWRQIVVLALSGFTLACTPMMAFANSTTFTDFRVGAGLPDPTTEKTTKSGGGSYENSFYVTITAMAPSDATLKTQSIMELNAPYEDPIVSDVVYVRADSKESGDYTTQALANRYYRMKTMFVNASTNQVTFSGRYTP